MPVRICLLGPVAVVGDDGQPVDVGGPRARALLARLATDPGRVVGLDALIDAVWDGDPPAAPGNAVQAVVSRLRRALPELPLRAQAHGYVLDLPAGAVDAAEFEALVARARGEREPAEQVATLTAAEQLWRGPALADLRDLAFTAAPAARWAELRLSAAELRLAALLQLGRGADALPEVEDLVAAHPLREPFVVLEVRALAQLGRPAEALAAYERCRELLAEELGADPSPALQAEHLAVLRGQAEPPRRPAARGNALRAPLTSFRGRDDELDAVRRSLDAGRLVTLLGPGGAGKTRLALEAAHRRRGEVRDGVWWVELAPVADARLLPAAVLSAVGQREGTSLERVPTVVEASARLQETFSDRRALLVLDNCEHLVAAVASFTDDLLAHCPGLQVLTTSREPLGVPGEAVLPVGPLAVPGEDDEAAADSAVVRLFADRAAAVRPDFAITPATLPAVLEVCRRLDGMPLALELAAARLRTLGIRQIADRLDDRFSLLTGGSRVALPRHQTLRAVVEWSWEALGEQEQAVARRLSVFVGGATLETAEQVCGDPGWTGGAVLDAITGLVEKSMLLAVEEVDGVRYRMLETIRAYAGEQLTAAGERSAVEAAQAAWCLAFVDEHDPQLRGAGQLAALQRMHAEHDGLLAVLQRAIAAGDGDVAVHLGARLSWYWLLTGRQVAAGRWLTQALTAPGGSAPLRAACRAFSAMGNAEGGDWRAALPALREVTELPPEHTYGSPEPLGALAWGFATVFTGRFRSMEGLAKLERHPDPWVVATAHGVRAQVAENMGQLDGLGVTLAGAHEEFVRLGDRWGRSFTAAALGQLAMVDGDTDAAVDRFSEALRLSEELGTTDDTPMLRIRLALAHALAGDLPRAEREVEAVLADLGRDGGALHLAMAETAAGGFALQAGRVDDAERWLRSAQEHVRAATGGPPQIAAMVDVGTATVLAARAEVAADDAGPLLAEAHERLAAALRLGVEVAGDMPVAADAVQALAGVVRVDGDPERSARLLGMAGALRGRRDRGNPGAMRTEQRLRAELGTETFERLRAAGEAVPRDDVLVELGVDATGGFPGVPLPAAEGQTRRR